MKKLFFILVFCVFTNLAFSQYRNRDGNRIGLSAGVSQTSLFTSDFDAKPGMGFAGGLSVRGNYYNNWSMIYGMQFFSNNFSLESTSLTSLAKETEFNLQGVQVRLLLSYNVVENHVSFDFGPVLQINGKLSVNERDQNNILNGTALTAKQIEEVSTINGNFYAGFSAGGKVVRAVIFYEYGFTNIFSKLNKNDDFKILTGNQSIKGNLGTINGQIIFNL
jgi:hypothetical protein